MIDERRAEKRGRHLSEGGKQQGSDSQRAEANHFQRRARGRSDRATDRTMESFENASLAAWSSIRTAKVTGKVLTPDDQRRLQEEAAREVAS